jgi:hypothetical protein
MMQMSDGKELAALKPGYNDHLGRPKKYSDEAIEKALWELAAAGGNANRASQALFDMGITQDEEDLARIERGEEVQGRPIPSRTLRYWKNTSHRNRYHEIRHTGVRELEERIAEDGIDLASEIMVAEQQALRQTMAGLPHASSAEAAQILRNLSQSKDLQVKQAMAIRGQGQAKKDSETLEQIARELKRMGVPVMEEPVDAEVIDEATS